MRKLNVFLVLLALVVLSTTAQAAIRKGPYLMYNGNNTQMEVLWQIDATTTCTLEWGLDTSYSMGSVQSTEYGTDHQHRYNISSLTPGTKHYYRVTEGSNTYTGSFNTAPAASATAVKLFAWGDCRTEIKYMDQVTEQMVATYTADPAFQTIALHSGDWISGNTEGYWASEFFNRDYANNLELQANVPQAGCIGNHEGGGSVYRKYYPYPYQANHYFSFDYGPVHVVVIDTHQAAGGYASGSAQYNWLVNDLQNTTKPWKIAVYHAPAWSAGYHGNNTTAQTYLHPLFVQYDVPIVINGHNHYYARCDVDGIQHITSGGGGAWLYAGSAREPYVVEYAKKHHHCEIDIQDNELTFTAVDKKGSVIETFTLSTGSCTPTDMHIEDVACAEVNCGQGKKNGRATVTIYDDCGDPVSGALVDVTFTGDFSETIYDVATNGSGVAVITTTGCIKKPSFTATVIDVTHGTLPYDSNDNVTDNCSG